MIYRLKNRDKPLPGGVGVYDPGTGYRANAFDSFTVQANGVMNARLGNPGFVARYKLPTDYASCEEFVDTQLGRIAFDHGWSDYFVATSGGGSPGNAAPFPQSARRVNRVVASAAGIRTIYEWIKTKEEAAPAELANKRAETCANCPLNEQGNIADFFQTAAANAILHELEQRKGWDLITPFDDKLGICSGCYCVNKLSVHCDLEVKLKHMPKDAHDALHPSCWVLSEEKALPEK